MSNKTKIPKPQPDLEETLLSVTAPASESVPEDAQPHICKLIPESEVIKFRTEQMSDLSLGHCFAEAHQTKSDFVTHKDTGILYHRARTKDNMNLQVVVPSSQRSRVITLAHEGTGHWSYKKTLKILRRNYFWPGIRKDVEAFVKSCEACQRRARVTVADSAHRFHHTSS